MDCTLEDSVQKYTGTEIKKEFFYEDPQSVLTENVFF